MNIELEQQVTIDLDKLTDADRKALLAVLDAPKPFPQKGDDVATSCRSTPSNGRSVPSGSESAQI